MLALALASVVALLARADDGAGADDASRIRAASLQRLASDASARGRALWGAIDSPAGVHPTPDEAAAFAGALTDEGLESMSRADATGSVHWLERASAWAEFADDSVRATVHDWRGQVLAGSDRASEARVEFAAALAWFRGAGDPRALSRCLRHTAWSEYRAGNAKACVASLAEQGAVLAAAARAGIDLPLLEDRRDNAFVSALVALDARDVGAARREIARFITEDRRAAKAATPQVLLEADVRRPVSRGELAARLLAWTDTPALEAEAFTLATALIENERARVLLTMLAARGAPAPHAEATIEELPPLGDGVAELRWFAAPVRGIEHMLLLARCAGRRCFADLGARSAIESLVSDYRAKHFAPEASLAPPAEFERDSLAVARAVLGPALEFFGGDAPPRRVIVMPEGAIGRLPFATLVLRERDGGGGYESLRFLVRSAAVVVVPSRAVLRSLSPPCAEDGVLFLATPELWFSNVEGAAVARLHRRVRFLDGDDASAAQVGAALRAESFGWLHLGCHAEADPRLANRSVLVLRSARAGREPEAADRLSAADVARLPLTPGARVVLSACGTATGDLHRGEGVLGVWRAFLAAGASSVIATLEDVDDRSAATVTVRMHEAAASGLPLAEALRAAQAAWLDGSARPVFPRGSAIDDPCHPSLWGAWVCVGNDGGPF